MGVPVLASRMPQRASFGDFVVGPSSGSAPRLETLWSQLGQSRRFLLSAARELSATELSAAPRPAQNSIGAILSHIAAAERMFVNMTALGRTFDSDEEPFRQAFRFEGDPLAGSSLDAYIEQLASVRQRTRAVFLGKDDGWLTEPRTFFGAASNNHYYWTHLLMDEARHTGQIILIRKYLLPDADAEFDPYAEL